MKKSDALKFYPNRTNLLSGDQYNAIIKAAQNIINGYDTEHLYNRKGKAYLKLKRDYTRDAKTPFYFYAYTYTRAGDQVDITKEFHKHYGMALLDKVLGITAPYNERYM